jgi:hypothetical protein
MNRFVPAIVAVVSLYAGGAAAQMPAVQRLEGTVAAVTDKSLTLTAADGTNTSVDLLPGRSVTIVEPITVDQIQAGSYVATANKTQPDGTGVSVEIRVFPPNTPRFDVNRAMDDSGTMMTNGVVATAVSVDGNRRLTVDYGSGTRTITVPPNISITSNTPGSLDLIKPGIKIGIVTIPAGADRPGRQLIRINKADLPK